MEVTGTGLVFHSLQNIVYVQQKKECLKLNLSE